MIAVASDKGLYDPRHEHDSCGMGFVAHVRGQASHKIIAQGLQILANLHHRGGVGADPDMGDGAGCLIQLPDDLLRAWGASHDVELPRAGDYAVAMCFLPTCAESRSVAEERLAHFVRKEGQQLLGWRDVPVDTSELGETVRATVPVIRQAIVGRGPGCRDQGAFERKLLTIRKQTLNPLGELARTRNLPGLTDFYIASFSTRTLV